jgi:fermentation-respiration switch protein FrsA (DUF1100 family)
MTLTLMRRDVEFTSGGVTCRAWLFLPKGDDSMAVPCIVMAHGFGATRECGLEPYAIRFAEDGHAVLVFDYRHFGASDGSPRQLLSVKRQLEDWQSAIRYARTAERVDPSRVALWGTSFSGGHVISAAVEDGRVVAVSSQCPLMDGSAAFLAILRYAGVAQTLRIGWHAALDLARGAVGAAPHLIPIAGPPGSLAAMTSEDAEAGYKAICPPTVQNAVTARIGLTLGGYRPGKLADRLPCPVLIQICDKDTVAPPKAAEAAAALAGARAEVKHYPVGHFDVYLGKDFEQSVADQRAFFRRHLASQAG